MRVNIRKITFITGLLVLVWIVVSFSSVIEVSRSVPSNNVNDLEKRIVKLQKDVKDELSDSNLLLERVRERLKTQEMKNLVIRNGPDENNDRESLSRSSSPVLPVLVIACDRVTVKRCLDNLVKFRPNRDTFPIIVSQDCGHNATYEIIKSFTDQDSSISVVRQPDLSEIPLHRSKIKFRGYYKIARHYRFALNHVLVTLGHEAVIIVEDDLDISPDFFEYFLGTYPLLEKDPTLWCVSAWNDNGKKELIELDRPEMLHRTDFFPGLGWLIRRDTWLELEPNWPLGFFDDWMRDPENTRGRACIRPEISRTYSFGKVGVSKGLFFDMHLRYMHLNSDYVEFTKLDLSYLLKDQYDPAIEASVYNAAVSNAEQAALGGSSSLRVPYKDAKTYQRAAKKLGLMDDFRSGIPRTAYRGVVSCYIRGRRVYLAPNFKWEKYDPNWG